MTYSDAVLTFALVMCTLAGWMIGHAVGYREGIADAERVFRLKDKA